jgi:hypothetical protein
MEKSQISKKIHFRAICGFQNTLIGFEVEK